SISDLSIIFHLTHRSCLGGVKVCHKRQALQDMARPLKQWLYKHKENPYPTKTEKVLLALGSHMTLVQVSNWFANARRRLKNTVSQPDLSWALRIKLYNKYIQGNAERMSVSSEDTNSEDDECHLQTPASQPELSRSSLKSVIKQENRTDPAFSDDYVSPPPKYKSSLLNRYINDTLRHVMATPDDVTKSHLRNHSGSFSSNECDDDLVSPSSSEAEANSLYHMGQRREEAEWREIHAAMALTNLAQGQCCATGTTTTSCIIQKSSHISEIKTVKVSLPNNV
uniref:Homeobox domain-containing protein n=1 Tax=Oncorhynchus tshawytscha TaxID=74940 RepID=A0A8C8ER04_ONCTS